MVFIKNLYYNFIISANFIYGGFKNSIWFDSVWVNTRRVCLCALTLRAMTHTLFLTAAFLLILKLNRAVSTVE